MLDSIKPIWLRLKALVHRKQLDVDLDDEVAFHLATWEEKNRASGTLPSEARYAAHRQFGNATNVKESTRELWTFASLEALWRTFASARARCARIPGSRSSPSRHSRSRSARTQRCSAW